MCFRNDEDVYTKTKKRKRPIKCFKVFESSERNAEYCNITNEKLLSCFLRRGFYVRETTNRHMFVQLPEDQSKIYEGEIAYYSNDITDMREFSNGLSCIVAGSLQSKNEFWNRPSHIKITCYVYPEDIVRVDKSGNVLVKAIYYTTDDIKIVN